MKLLINCLAYLMLFGPADLLAQDVDTDGDGISDEVEQQYSFLDPEFYGDVFEDHDGDAVGTYYELLSGFAPDVADVHDPVNIFEYYPMENRDYTYETTEGERYVISIRSTSDPRLFEVTNTLYDVSSDPTIYRVSSGGIFLENTDSQNYSILPELLTLGQVKGLQGRYSDELAEFYRTPDFVHWFLLEEMGQLSWMGNSYDYLVIGRPSQSAPVGARRIYLKGVGLYTNSNGDQLISFENVNYDPVQEQIESLGGDSGGGGLSLVLICILLLTTWCRLKTSSAS